MNISCRFPNCSWLGNFKDLLCHCEVFHTENVKKINNTNGFIFTVSDLLEDAFLLSTQDGLYWFLLDESEQGSSIKRGIFVIDQSSVYVYTSKIDIGEEAATYIGPYQTATDYSQYDLSWWLGNLYHRISTTSIEINFGTHDDNDVFSDQHEDWIYITDQGIVDVDFKPVTRDTYNLDKFDCIACFDELGGQSCCPVCTADKPTNYTLEKPCISQNGFTELGNTDSIGEKLCKYVDEDEREYIGVMLE